MIRVVRDGARVPSCGVLPGGLADGECRPFQPRFHAAAARLLDDRNIGLNEFQSPRYAEQGERLSGSSKEIGRASNLDTADYNACAT
jgi:hypothetical protein